MPDTLDVEGIVRKELSASADRSLTVSSSRTDDGYITVRIDGPACAESTAVVGGTRSARIATSGVEAFFLVLGDRWHLREFEWRPEDQPQLVRQLATLAAAYLDGVGEEVQKKGIFGRSRRYLRMELGGETYWLSER